MDTNKKKSHIVKNPSNEFVNTPSYASQVLLLLTKVVHTAEEEERWTFPQPHSMRFPPAATARFCIYVTGQSALAGQARPLHRADTDRKHFVFLYKIENHVFLCDGSHRIG